MVKEGTDELLERLWSIAFWAEGLPPSLSGWINVLGLYVKERNAGAWSSISAGGSLRAYLVALREANGKWQIKKFDKDTWDRRFAALVGPTMDIVGFLRMRMTVFGEGDVETVNTLNAAVQQYQRTGKWIGFPYVSNDPASRQRDISSLRQKVKRDTLDDMAWTYLGFLYGAEKRYKDMENALKTRIAAQKKRDPIMIEAAYAQLGMFYLAALSTSIRGKGIPIVGHVPSNVSTDDLGYSSSELRSLAKENLGKAREMQRESENAPPKELELALKAVEDPSSENFTQLDRWAEAERDAEEKRRAIH